MDDRVYTVVVGNIGMVYEGHNFPEAKALFDYYTGPEEPRGRGEGEEVTLFVEYVNGLTDVLECREGIDP